MSELKDLIEKEKQRDTVQKARVMYFYKEGTSKRLFYSIHGKGGYFTKWMKKWVEYPHPKI